MKINELIQLVDKKKSKVLKADQLHDLLKKELEVKEYMSIKDKKQLVQNIINECILYDNGVFKFNDIDKYINFTMMTIAAYTNIELSDDVEEDYDMLCSNKLLDFVVGTFNSEYDNVNVLLQMQCDYVLSDNNVEAQVGRFLNDVLVKVDEVANSVANKVDSIDLSKISIDGNKLAKVLSLFNK